LLLYDPISLMCDWHLEHFGCNLNPSEQANADTDVRS